MWASRLKQFSAMISIGDGVLTLIAPRNHVALWLLGGPKRLRKLAAWFAKNPVYTRLGGIVEIGFGIWLALRQYKEAIAPQPWYQRWLAQYRLLLSWLAPLALLAIVLAVILRRTTRGKTPSEEDQARDELTVEEAVAEESSSKDMRSIIEESIRRSERQR